jgi:hypothetical protein
LTHNQWSRNSISGGQLTGTLSVLDISGFDLTTCFRVNLTNSSWKEFDFDLTYSDFSLEEKKNVFTYFMKDTVHADTVRPI